MSTQLRLIKGTGGQGSGSQSGGHRSTARGSASRSTGRSRASRRRRQRNAPQLSARTLADLRLDAQTRDRGIQGIAEARRRLASLQPPEPSLSQAS